MERGYLLWIGVRGLPVRDGRQAPLGFFLAPRPGHSREMVLGEVIRPILPGRLARHPEEGEVWHLCPSCRLLHYPEPVTEP